MASTTSNLGLTKPAGTDKALVSVINTNSDILDRSAGGLMDAIAIVANGNTHAAISAGQYVYVHNHGTLAEGLYTANSAIAANATLSTSNLTADASGGLNALNNKLAGLFAKEWKYVNSLTVGANNIADATITVTKTGYTFIGILGWIINSGDKCSTVYARYYDANTAVVRIYNPTSNSVTTGSINVLCLYCKTDSGVFA